VFNTVKVRLRNYRTVSSAIAMCKAACAAGWTVILSADEGCVETTETFLADFAVGIGVTQLMIGSIETGEGVAKINRLLEIARENETLPFVGR
jgi:enolase